MSDLISRQAMPGDGDLISRRSLLRNILKRLGIKGQDYLTAQESVIVDCIYQEKSIESAQPEYSKLAIDAEALMDAFYKTPQDMRTWSRAWALINRAKLAQPERKTGRITYTHFSEELWGQSAICISCGCKWQIAEGGEDNFCPNCGADMRSDRNDD